MVALFAIVRLSASENARDRFYAWPPGPDFPDAMGDAYWDWLPGADPDGDRAPLLDLRHLNEPVAGQDGWVQRRGDRLFLANGEPVRFWAVNATGNAPVEDLDRFARRMAQHGVNMIRIHGGASKTLLDFKTGRLDTVNAAVVDQMHRAVVAAKRHGIYTFVSNTFFIIQLQVKASYGLEGYTQAWLDAHPKNHVPFGLVFLNDKLRAAFKGWVREFVTRPNPYDANKIPLARDPAVAVIEILNEDNLFFFTFRPEAWPPEQRQLAGARFFQWVAKKYHRPADADPNVTVARAVAAWDRRLPEDLPEAGVLALVNAAEMTQSKQGAQRIADQMEFLGDVQRGFHAEMVAMLRGEGYDGLVSASNWKTADDSLLLDLEHDTYKEGDIIDRHAYYSPVISEEKVKWRIEEGDQFLGFSYLANPQASPTNVRQTVDYPSAMSESAWVNYNPAGVEGPLAAAAYFSLVDFDMPVWFAMGNERFSEGLSDRLGKWTVGRPSVLGQFPGAALLFRRGDVAEASVVVREGRTLQTIYRGEPAQIMPARGFDSTRDDPENFGRGSVGWVDPLAMFVGKVETTTSTDADEVSPRLGEFIDRVNGRVTSITGELVTDWLRGLLLIDTPRSQAVSGFLRANGEMKLRDVTFTSENAFGALLAIALDGRPLAASGRILIQVGAIDRLTGFRTKTIPLSVGGQAFAGHQIERLGGPPWQVERVDATVTLRGMAARVRSAVALDVDGRARETLAGTSRGGDYVLKLPSDAIYAVIELNPVD